MPRRLTAALALTLLPAAAAAQSTQLAFELGGGLSYAPAYEGSDEYTSRPKVQGALNSVSFGAFGVSRGETLGFSFGPSFGFVGARDSSEHRELKGIDDIDWAVEVGAKVGYTWEYAEVSAAVRRGFNGHEGVVGELTANAILRPDDLTTVRVGPKVSFADGEYADTYFSVPGSAVNLSPYSADGGLKSVGVAMVARRELTADWSIEGAVSYDRLMNDFADSPITQSEDQYKASVTLIRQFDWRF